MAVPRLVDVHGAHLASASVPAMPWECEDSAAHGCECGLVRGQHGVILNPRRMYTWVGDELVSMAASQVFRISARSEENPSDRIVRQCPCGPSRALPRVGKISAVLDHAGDMHAERGRAGGHKCTYFADVQRASSELR